MRRTVVTVLNVFSGLTPVSARNLVLLLVACCVSGGDLRRVLRLWRTLAPIQIVRAAAV